MKRTASNQRLAIAGLTGGAMACAGGCGTLVHESWSDERRSQFMQRTFEPGMSPADVERGLSRVKGARVVTDAPAPTPEQWDKYVADRPYGQDRAVWSDRVPGELDPYHYEDVAAKRGWSGPRLMQAPYADLKVFEVSKAHGPWMWFAFDDSDELAMFGIVDPSSRTHLTFPKGAGE